MYSNAHILILHDCLFAAECLSLGLSADPNMCVVDLMAYEEANFTMTHRPVDIVLIHLAAPWPAVLRPAAEINAEVPGAKIVILGVPPGESHMIDCIKSGALAWLPKSASLQEVRRTLANINEGKLIYAPRLTYRMFRCLSELSANGQLTEGLGATMLTGREMEVMELLADEKSNEQIAASLHLSVHTVKKHVHNILERLQIRSRSQLLERPDLSNES